MSGNLDGRIGKLERKNAPDAGGGLYTIIGHDGDGPLPEPVKTGGLTIIYVRAGDERLGDESAPNG